MLQTKLKCWSQYYKIQSPVEKQSDYYFFFIYLSGQLLFFLYLSGQLFLSIKIWRQKFKKSLPHTPKIVAP
jgi:hypothetical protein